MRATLLILAIAITVIAEAQTWKKYNDSNSGLPTNTVHAMDLDTSSNTLWIGTSHYLVTLQHDSIWDTITTVFPNNPWFAVKVDSRGDVWVGGDTDCKLYRFSNGTMTEFTDSINSIGEVRAIEEDAYGNIWVGITSAYSLRMYDGNRWHDYSDSVLNEGIWAMELGFDSTMWFGSWAEELFKYDGQNFTHYGASNSPMPNSQVRSIARGNYPDMWIGTRNGLLRFDGDTTWRHWTESGSPLYDDEIYALAVDNDTVTWIGYNGGSSVGTYDSTGYGRINYPFSSVSFTHSIVIAPDGKKWIGGQGGLLSYVNGGSGPIEAPIRNSGGPTSINDLEELAIYPNPSVGHLYIDASSKEIQLRVIDPKGQLVTDLELSNEILDLELPAISGVYFLTIEMNGKVETRKILKL